MKKVNILSITAKTEPEKEFEFKQTFKSALAKTSRFEGVKNFFYQSLFEEDVYYIRQEWDSSTKLQTYLSSKEYKYLIGAVDVLGELIEQKIYRAEIRK